MGSSLELRRGSVTMLYWVVSIGLLTNVSCFVLGLAAPGLFFTYGLWDVILGISALDAWLDPRDERQFGCCPITLRTKTQPILWLLLMWLMMMRWPPMLSMLIGLGWGYAFAYFPALELRADRVRRWEQPDACLSWLTSRDTFIAIDRADQIQPFQFGQPPQQQPEAKEEVRRDANGRELRGAPRAGTMSDSTSGGAARPSVFSGQGHKLGHVARPSATPSQSSSVVIPIGSSGAGADGAAAAAGAGGGAASGKTRRPGMGHVLADRLAKKASAAGTKSPTATTTTATPSASTSSSTVPIVGPVSMARPGGAAGAMSPASTTATATPSASRMFSVGDVDGADDEDVGVAQDSHVIAVGDASPQARPSSSGGSKEKDKKKKKGDMELQPMLFGDGGGGSAADNHDPDSQYAADPFQLGVQRIVATGASHDDALRVMNAADGDVERALQLLNK